MKMFFRLALLAVAVAAGVWLWMWLFPPPEKIIRARVMTVARCASFAPGESAVTRVGNLSRLTDCFDPNVRIYLDVDIPDMGRLSLSGRDEITQAELTARSRLSSVEVKFVGINIALGPDRESAVVDLTARVAARGDENFFVGELQFFFKKTKSEWLITRIEPVKVLQ